LDNAEDNTCSSELYSQLHFPEPDIDLPYICLNMVATIDGKTLLGSRGNTAKGLGSFMDQTLMRRIQNACDGVIVGASTLRAGNVIYDPAMTRAVITASGNVPLNNRFFTDASDNAIVFVPECLSQVKRAALQNYAKVIDCGQDRVNVRKASEILRRQGIKKLLLEGGANLNFEFFAENLVKEIFLTVAPKLKGGTNLPGIADGTGFPDNEYLQLKLLSVYQEEDELYLRYKVETKNNQSS
jgi:2,5-diamino-6-(ribosylamino)-4(3H)-pyrimidinone 5'-phosphate reductase